MDQMVTYIILFGVIVIIGQLFNKSTIPIALILVMTGMLLSFLPHFPRVTLNPQVVLDIFLPVLIYQISSFSSLTDFKKNYRPIALLSVGHVIFITFLVAAIIHLLIPQFDWPLAIVLGAVISPPDDVAIITIAEKIRMPQRVVTILEGEGMLNDATALILFRFALAAVIIHQFSVIHAISTFFIVVICETLYGLTLGYILGELRVKIQNPILHMIASILTPFLAYFPAVMLGGCGVLATTIVGFMIGNLYATRFTPEFRLISRGVWPTIGFALQNIVFLLIGLHLRSILEAISYVPPYSLLLYSVSVILTIIIGRFFWVFFAVYFLPRFLFPSIRKKDPYPPWQFPFVVSWAGMRGGISLAAALAVPALPTELNGEDPRALLIFLVFCVIAATLLIQGLTLPWILKVIGIHKYGQREKCNEHLEELQASLAMTKAVLRWLNEYKEQIQDNSNLLSIVKLNIREYQKFKSQSKSRIDSLHNSDHELDESPEIADDLFISSQIIDIERTVLTQLWRKDKINRAVRDKLLERLDHRSKHLPE
jgi:monovalent cation/hydrogen antiporter